jgi:hypothetical protein
MSLRIELDNDHTALRVELPDGTFITLAADAWGMERLRELLLAQKWTRDKHYGKVGSRQVPTQYTIERFKPGDWPNPITTEFTVKRFAPKGRKIQKQELSLADFDLDEPLQETKP